MNFRIVLLGLGWLFVMILLFFSKNQTSNTLYFETIPSKAIIHGLLFWGLVHIWITALKKQFKHEFLKRNAFKIVFTAANIFAVLTELIVFKLNYASYFNYWNFAFDILGVFVGVISFRILYAQCY